MHENANGQSNGHSPAAAPTIVRALRILQIEPGTDYHIWTLSDKYGGLLTHFKQRSFYCGGKDCPSHVHLKSDTIWKGYAAVGVWNPATKKWMPWVLEISEHLELDFRGLWKRDQVWEIWRDNLGKKKTTPITAKLLEDSHDAKLCPPAFDYLPVLKTRYHTSHIQLNHFNPLPPRVLVEDVAGPGPEILASREGGGTIETPEDFKKFREEYERRKKTPTESKPK